MTTFQTECHDEQRLLPLQARLEEARRNWDAALASKDRALQQLEDSLRAERRSCQQHQAVAGESSAPLLLTSAQVIPWRHPVKTSYVWHLQRMVGLHFTCSEVSNIMVRNGTRLQLVQSPRCHVLTPV